MLTHLLGDPAKFQKLPMDVLHGRQYVLRHPGVESRAAPLLNALSLSRNLLLGVDDAALDEGLLRRENRFGWPRYAAIW